MIELAVVGAHLSGLPLHCDLLAAGARLLRAGNTRPIYRLFALAGHAPPRPGLLRSGEGGSAIAVEVHALPADGFGRFVASVPPPLSIGTLFLADGTTPKGFLVEPAGLEGATDISEFGGWRAWLARAAATPAKELFP
jgi:allophanate hydrolase